MKPSGRAASRKAPPRARRVPAAEPLAAALLDHHRDGRPRRVTALRADGVEFEIETDEYFTLDGELAVLDRLALDAARGRVLDVGAGSGRHALALQARGCEVVAIDVSPTCIELCRARGVQDARVYDVLTLPKTTDEEGDDADVEVAARRLGRFDTIFFGMQTIGVAGGVAPLRELLVRLRAHLRPGGVVLADSSELREAWDGDRLDRSPARGEIVLETRYRGLRGEPFPWLYLAEADLAAIAGEAGFDAEVLGRVPGGEYLVALRPREASASRSGSPAVTA
jgi:SAM-dependent methyltransferase